MDRSPASLSFIAIVDFTEEAKWLFVTSSVAELLGYEPHELLNRSSLELVHPDEFGRVKRIHFDTISKDKAAVLVYLRMKHKIPSRGYVLCGISRFVDPFYCVSFASPGKAMYNASTAQEIEVVAPHAHKYQIKRWHDPSPVTPPRYPAKLPSRASPASPKSPWNSRSSSGSISGSESEESRSPLPELVWQNTISFKKLPNQSLRTLFILDRFTVKGTILYCSNDNLIMTTSAMGQPFFDFVAEKDEDTVRNWIDSVKGWGVNDLGQPSDGGFGYGRFTLLTKGRDSCRDRMPEPSTSQSRHKNGKKRPARDAGRASQAPGRAHTRNVFTRPAEGLSPQVLVDAIFSAHSDGLMVVLRRSEDS
ncbi:hypothetical protein DXG03_004610 [Asterophora parasitica]|uniref:PAS domain-containing protein n=1 Tax=Asterophora parasitica TaxID=117018 RepID=A0A9P7GC51_9AGAR|nr:hypothetical protein DXG03_004610 [Asterophora parasitica]